MYDRYFLTEKSSCKMPRVSKFQMSDAGRATKSVRTTNTLGPVVCVLCNESFSSQFFTFGGCDHQLCYRCYNLLRNIPEEKRAPKCPICLASGPSE